MVRVKDFFPEVYDMYYIDENGQLYTDYGTKAMSNNALQNGYIVNSYFGENGYRKDMKRHFVVATVFLERTEGQDQINHKDGNKLNNNINNLEWCTSKENIRHAWDNNLTKARKGSKNNWAILNEEQVLEIAELLQFKTMTGRAIAKKYNVSPQTISAIKCRHNWADLTKDFNF